MATRKKPLKGGSPEEQFGLFQLDTVPNTFKKAVQIVHSKPKAPMSLLQRKLSNAWLRNAMQTQSSADGLWFSINQQSMVDTIKFNSNNRTYLQESALEMMKIVFEWDVLVGDENKRKGLFKASVLFPEIEIVDDVIRYQISNQLRHLVLNPEIYALIDDNVIYNLRRGSSAAIYEHCIRFVNIGKTTPVQWEEFRDMILGQSSDSKTYQAYKFFKSKVLKPSIAEVNAEADVFIELHEILKGRWVDTLQFTITRKSPALPNLDNAADEASLVLIGDMIALGLPQSEAKRLAKAYTAARVKAALQYTRKRSLDQNASKLENVGAYFRQALVNDWGVAEVIVPDGKSPVAPAKSVHSPAMQLSDAYLMSQMDDAKAYFNELDTPEQDEIVERYNEQQAMSQLKLKKAKPSKGATTAFYRWLARDTWGEPTSDQLLIFAQEMLAKK
jgi:hypothetical protein